jgi:hypothetical protein
MNLDEVLKGLYDIRLQDDNVFSSPRKHFSGWGRKRPETETEKKARLEHRRYIQSLNDSMQGVHSGEPNVQLDPEPFVPLTNQNKLSESEYKERFPMLFEKQAQQENLMRMRENLMRMQGGLFGAMGGPQNYE